MFGKIADVGKGGVALAHFLPILRRNLVTGVAGELLRQNVSTVRESRVIDARLFVAGNLFLGTSL